MARIEKTVFISYRRTDVYTALAVYENLKNQGYDVFFDYRSISSGDFEQIIKSNIRARAHFLLILTPTALDRCSEPGDWLRREIEFAVDEKRNIVPLFFKGFRFGAPSVSEKLTGKLKDLSRYNGLNVHEDYFEEAMQRVRTQFLSRPLNTVLHPVSTQVRKVVKAEQDAADEALKHKDDDKPPVKGVEEKPVESKESPKPVIQEFIKNEIGRLEESSGPVSKEAHKLVKKERDTTDEALRNKGDQEPLRLAKEKPVHDKETPKLVPSKPEKKKVTSPAAIRAVAWRTIGSVAGVLTLLALCFWGGASLWGNFSLGPEPTEFSQPTATETLEPEKTTTPSPTEPTLGIGSTIIGKDGMTLLYIPAGEFTMGSFTDVAVNECKKTVSPSDYDYCEGFQFYAKNEEPPHIVNLDAFWIDQTEVTNAMYEKCVDERVCIAPVSNKSRDRSDYFGNVKYENFPVIYVSWGNASTYCSWASRRLPTESEWEKAARGTDERIYPWGNEFPNENLTNTGAYIGDTTEVGSYPNGASPYGAMDMAGNVWEWVEDWYDVYPGNTLSDSSYGTTYRVMRGGSWSNVPDHVRSALRFTGYSPDSKLDIIGFRCAMDAE